MRSSTSSRPTPLVAWVGSTGKNRPVATAACRSSRRRLGVHLLTLEVALEQGVVLGLLDDRLDDRPRRRSASPRGADASSEASDSRSSSPVTVVAGPSGWTGRASGCASPKTRRQVATVSSKSARACSRRVTAMARGIPTAEHSRHSILVASSTPSAPETTKRAASAALSPARTSPTKSGLPGVSTRLTTTSPLAKLAATSPVDAARSSSLGRRPSTRAATRCSKSVLLPAPGGPTSTTLRICCGLLGAGASSPPDERFMTSPSTRPPLPHKGLEGANRAYAVRSRPRARAPDRTGPEA